MARWRVRCSLLQRAVNAHIFAGESSGHSNDRREEAGGRAFRCREKSSVGKTHCERLQLLCLVFYIFLCKVTCNRHRLATLLLTAAKLERVKSVSIAAIMQVLSRLDFVALAARRHTSSQWWQAKVWQEGKHTSD